MVPPLLVYLRRSLLPSGIYARPWDISIKWHDFDDILDLNQIATLAGKADGPLSGEVVPEEILLYAQTFNLLAFLSISTLHVGSIVEAEGESVVARPHSAWRSLEISQERGNWVGPGIEVQDRIDLNFLPPDCLETLQTLEVQGFSLTTIGRLPMLTKLHVEGGNLNSTLEFEKLEHLIWVDFYDTGIATFDGEPCGNLQTLVLPKLREFTPPISHNFPFLTSIILTGSGTNQSIIPILSTIFNASRPLRLLALAERDMMDLVELIEGFDFVLEPILKTLALSSRNFETRPKHITWDWNEFGRATWPMTPEEIEYAQSIGYWALKRHFSIQAMDRQMKRLLRAGQKRQLDAPISSDLEENDGDEEYAGDEGEAEEEDEREGEGEDEEGEDEDDEDEGDEEEQFLSLIKQLET